MQQATAVGSLRKNSTFTLVAFVSSLLFCCLVGLAALFVPQDARAAQRFPFNTIDQTDPGGDQPLPPPTPIGNLETPSPPAPSDTKKKLCEELRKAGQVPDFCK